MHCSLKKYRMCCSCARVCSSSGSSCSLCCSSSPCLGKKKSTEMGRRSQELFWSAPVAASMCSAHDSVCASPRTEFPWLPVGADFGSSVERAELVPLGSGSVHSVSRLLLLLLFGVAFGDLETVAVCILFPYCTASKWLRFIKDLRLHLIVLIIFLRACAGGVTGVEPDTLLVGFELHFRSLCGVFGTLLFFGVFF